MSEQISIFDCPHESFNPGTLQCCDGCGYPRLEIQGFDRGRSYNATRIAELEREVERVKAACREAGDEIMRAGIHSSHASQWKLISKAHSILCLAVGDKDVSMHDEIVEAVDNHRK